MTMTREEAIQILRTRIVPTMNWQEIHEAIDMAIDALQADVISRKDTVTLNSPISIQAVQGEWVRKEKEYNDCDGHSFVYWYECDQCGARPPKDQWKNEWHSNFCPNCGARMKGGDAK